jgi:type II secretory pathway pseudopilin PulG
MQIGSHVPVRRSVERGFSFVVVLLLLAVMSAGSVAMASIWSAELRRERERELLHIGSLYARAIKAYHDAAPGGVKQYPSSLDDLLLDQRYVGTVRYIRKLYTDPTQPGTPLDLVIGPDQTVQGVVSTNPEAPLRQQPLDLGFTTLPKAQRYSEWRFVARSSP